MATDFVLKARTILKDPENLKSWVDKINRNVNQSFKNLTADVKLKVDRTQLKSAETQLTSTIDKISSSSKKGAKSVQVLESSMEKLGKQAAISIRRFGAFALVISGFYKLTSAISNSIGEALEFQDQMVKIGQVTGLAVKDLANVEKQIRNLSIGLGVSSKDLAAAGETFLQTGYSINQTNKALQSLAKVQLSATFSSDAKANAEGFIAIQSQFGGSIDKLQSKLDSAGKVAKKFAIESEDIISATKRTGGAFASAGGSFEEFISLLTSVRSTTRESADSIATGFRTIFTRIQRPKTLEFLKTFGVDLKNAEGLFVGPYEAIRRLNSALKDIPTNDTRFSQILEELGGYRQISKTIPLIKEFAKAEDARRLAMQAAGDTELDAIRRQESLLNSFTKLREELLLVINNFLNDEWIRNLIKLFTVASSAALKLTDSLRPLLPLLTTVAAVGVIKAVPDFSKGLKTLFQPSIKRANGGIVPGVGSSDNVPAYLTPGEYVLNKKAVKAIGVSKLNFLNAQKFAKGGVVGKSASIGGIIAAGASSLLSYEFKDLNTELKNTISFIKDFGLNLAILSLILAKSEKKIGLEDIVNKIEESTKKSSDIIINNNEKLVEAIKSISNSPTLAIKEKIKKKPKKRIISINPTGQVEPDDINRINETYKNLKPRDYIEKRSIKQPKDTIKSIIEEKNNILEKTKQNRSNRYNKDLFIHQMNSGKAQKQYEKELFLKKMEDGKRNAKRRKLLQSLGISETYANQNNILPITPVAPPTLQQIPKPVLNTDYSNIENFSTNKLRDLYNENIKKDSIEDIRGPRLPLNPKKETYQNQGASGLFDPTKTFTNSSINPTLLGFGPKQKKKILDAIKQVEEYDPVFASLLNDVSLGSNPNKVKFGNKLVKAKGSYSKNQLGGGVINLDTSRSVDEIASTIVHELTHRKQDITGQLPTKPPVYNNRQEYLDNPFEVEARNEQSRFAQFLQKKRRRNTQKTENSAYDYLQQTISPEFRLNPDIPFDEQFPPNSFITGSNSENVDVSDATRRKLKRDRRGLFGNSRLRLKVAGKNLNSFANRSVSNISNLNSKISNSKIGQTLSGGVGIGALALAGATGSLLSNIGQSRIEKGQSSGVGLATAGGAISSAVNGAALGSLFGPLGTAVGGLSGAVIGATLSFKNASKELESIKFNESIKPIISSLSDFSKGLSDPSTQLFQISSGLDAFEKRLSSATGDDLVSAKGQFNDLAPEIEKFFQKIAENSSTFDHFSAVANDSIGKFARINNVDYNKLIKGYKDQIDGQNKNRDALLKFNSALDESSNRILTIQNFATAVQKAARSIEDFENSISFGIRNRADKSSVFENLSTDSINRSKQLDRFTGGSFSKEIEQSFQASELLPSILNKIKNSSVQDGDIYTQIKAGLPDNPVTGNLINAIREQIGGTLDSTKFLDSLQQDFTGTLDKLREKLTPLLGIYKDLETNIARASSTFSSSLQEIANKEEEITNRRGQSLDNVNSQVRFNAAVQQVDPNYNILQQIDRTKLQNISGQANNSPQNLALILDRAIKNRDDLNKRIQNAGPENLQNLIKAQNEQEKVINSTTRALEFLGDATSRTAILQEKLAREQNKHQAKTDFATNFISSGSTDRGQILKNISRARNATTLEIFKPEDRKAILDLLDQFSDQKLFNGLTGKQRKQQLIESDLTKGGVDSNTAALLSGRKLEPQEQKLVDDINQQFAESNQALTELNKVQNDQLATINETLNTGFTGVINSIKESFNEAQQKDISRQITDSENKLDTLNKQVSDFKNLSKYGINSQDGLNAAKSQLEQASSLPGVQSKEVDLAKKKAQILQLINGSNGNLGDVKDQIGNQLAGFDPKNIENVNRFLKNKTRIDTPQGPNHVNYTEPAKKAVEQLFNKEFESTTAQRKEIQTSINRSNNPKLIYALNNNYQGLQKDINKLEDVDVNNLGVNIEAENNNLKDLKKRRGYASGGFVSGSGTGDTVPARLTPGEFVLNKRAVQNIGISNLNKVNTQRFATGGVVRESINIDNHFLQAIKDFSKITDKLSESLNNFPSEISHTINGKVEVIINGAEVLTRIMPEVQELIEAKVKDGISQYSRKNFPDLLP